MTMITSFLPPPDERSLAVRPSETANQRDSWLRQMELAQVADMNQAGRHAASATPARSTAQRPLPVQPPAARPASPMPAGPAAPAPGPGNDQSHGCQAARAPAAGAARRSTAGLAKPPAATQFAAASASSGTAWHAEEATLVATTALLSRQLRTRMAASAMQQDAAAEGTDSEAPVLGETAATEAPVWEERKIHFTGQGEEVNVWIRDNALTAPAGAQVVAQLAQEIAGMGLRMKNVTINGKLVAADGKAPSTEQQHRINHPEKTHGTR